MKGFIATNLPFISSHEAIPFDKLKEWLLWRINSHGKVNGALMKLWNINGIEINGSKHLYYLLGKFNVLSAQWKWMDKDG